jgi:hypothetical protein
MTKQSHNSPSEHFQALQIQTSKGANDGGIHREQAPRVTIHQQGRDHEGPDSEPLASIAIHSEVALSVITYLEQTGAKALGGQAVPRINAQPDVRSSSADGAAAVEPVFSFECQGCARSTRLGTNFDQKIGDNRVQCGGLDYGGTVRTDEIA